MEQADPGFDKDFATNYDGFPIVGVGASAGGLEALEQFFIHMPENCGMAFVVIQHLSPDHKGMLGELLQRITKMQVRTVTELMIVEQNCVYVIPSDKSMSILHGTLHLFKPVEKHGLRLPIDFFFRSLADDQKEQSIGIILSGMGSDGSLGLKAIKERAGMVLVQDPVSAKFDSMPRNAMEAVVADIVAPVSELPEKLITLTKQPPTTNTIKEKETDTGALEKVINLLREQTGNDFSQYKKSTMYRRIERRMGIHQLNNISSYVRYLQENTAEIDILFKELLIGVTNFFRDATAWEHLKETIFPHLLAKLPQRYVLRAWIPGCSTGEEAYSLAIVFKEALEQANLHKNITLQIFATDLDSNAIDKARKGIYTANIVADVTAERLNHFFTKVDDQYKVNTTIREMVVFAPQNVIKDPPFTRLDILSCRNMLIYMDTDLQKRLMTLFHYSLNPGGILLLGSAETHGSQGSLFATINSKLRIYQRSGESHKEELFNFQGTFSRNKPVNMENQSQTKIPDNIQTLTDQLLLQQFSPASVLVTDKGDILYLTGNTGKYLTPAAGKANMNVFAMAREDFRNELPAAFRKALQSSERVILPNVRVGKNGENHVTDIIIQQIEKPATLKNKLLIIFADVPAEKRMHTKQRKGKSAESALEAELKFEMLRIKEELESTREEMQTSQEELKSTNEELQSTNEELQSANEELTTSKEEMQSLNEELQTVNVELQSKIDDSVRANNDMNNLLNSIEIATLFLDKELNIRQFTTPATKIFKLKQSDIGRLFTDQVTDLDYPDMYDDALEVLRTLVFVEKPISTRDGRWFNIRIMPYRTFEDKIDGLVFTFINITTLKQMENTLKDSRQMLHSLIETLPVPVLSLSADGNISEFNREAEKLSGYPSVEVVGKNFFTLFIPESLRNEVVADFKKLNNGILPDHSQTCINAKNGDNLVIEWTSQQLSASGGALFGFVKSSTNTTRP